jgi:hypothetical protein
MRGGLHLLYTGVVVARSTQNAAVIGTYEPGERVQFLCMRKMPDCRRYLSLKKM